MKRTELYLLRHGTTDANVHGLFLGRTDAPLNAQGLVEAGHLGRRLAGIEFDALVSSDLSRARQTAAAIHAHHPALVLHIDPRVREMDLGDLDGRPSTEVARDEPELLAAWRADPSTVRMPGPSGETLKDVQDRASAALDDLADRFPGGRVAVVTHTFVLLSLMCRVLELPLSRFRRLFVDRASLSVVDWRRDDAVLRRFNETAHLALHPAPPAEG
ncbi:MAG: histidine phosphatase family protein [Myxococcales bacterium]|nr:histidine phosphatase family protein [Myxococcales bacterium]